jgi:CBS domain-containing protein
VHEIAEFLRRFPPFDALSEDEAEALAASVDIEYFAAGATVRPQDGSPGASVRVVRTGAVELVANGAVLDLLGEGDLFGHASMLSGLPSEFAARAHEDTLVYRIPAEAAEPVLARPSGVRYVARSLLEWQERASRPAGLAVDAAARRVETLLRRAPVVVAPDTPIREAAQRMTDGGVTSAVVRLRDGVGIVTDRDLRSRVIAAGVPTDAPVSAVMSAPAYTVDHDRLGTDVLLEMLDRGVRHFPVLSATGGVIGVIADNDLLAAEARTPFQLRRAIGGAETPAAVATAAAGLPALVVALHDANVAPETIGRMITVIADAATRRLIELGLARRGDPAVPLCWLALGSAARRELVPASDLDNALAWDGDDGDVELRRELRALAAEVIDGLVACGFAACDNGAVASSPLFSRSFDAWRGAAASWLADPEQDRAVILVSVAIDGRPVFGVREGQALASAFGGARHHAGLMRRMARLALAHRPPTGFLRDLVVEHSGEHEGRLDVKRGGLLPVTDIARYVGMQAGVAGASTRARLEAAAAGGVLGERDAEILREAFDFLFALRLEHQVEQLRAGLRPDDFLDPRELNALTRRYLRDVFRAIARIQRGFEGELALRAR